MPDQDALSGQALWREEQNIEPEGREAAQPLQEAAEEIRVSVRELVEFIMRGGDIDNRHHASPEQAMQEGGGFTA